LGPNGTNITNLLSTCHYNKIIITNVTNRENCNKTKFCGVHLNHQH
jgi:hypothetical protein